jgi:hypothetical protein
MSGGFSKVCILAGCFFLASLTATAQEVIHALVGTISSVDSKAKTIAVKIDDGSEDRFKNMMDSRHKIVFDKSARTDAIAAADFLKTGERVIVYYFGVGDLRTIIALRSLGPGPFTKSTGTVVSFSRRERSLSITNQSGEAESFEVAPDAVVNTEMGAAAGLDFRPARGDSVRVTAVVANGGTTVVFINALAAD